MHALYQAGLNSNGHHGRVWPTLVSLIVLPPQPTTGRFSTRSSWAQRTSALPWNTPRFVCSHLQLTASVLLPLLRFALASVCAICRLMQST